MTIPDESPASPTEPQTPEEAEFLATYRELDAVDQVLVWSTILTELGQRSGPMPVNGLGGLEE